MCDNSTKRQLDKKQLDKKHSLKYVGSEDFEFFKKNWHIFATLTNSFRQAHHGSEEYQFWLACLNI